MDIYKEKFIVLGEDGQLAKSFIKFFKKEKISYKSFGRKALDITDDQALENLFFNEDFSVIINCAAYNFVDKAEDEIKQCYAVNAKAVEQLAYYSFLKNKFLTRFDQSDSVILSML